MSTATLHIDLDYLLDDYLPSEEVIRSVLRIWSKDDAEDEESSPIRDIVVGTIEEIIAEYPLTNVIEWPSEMLSVRRVQVTMEDTLFQSRVLDPRMVPPKDLHDAGVAVRAVILATYVYFNEFLDQYKVTEAQRKSMHFVRWINKRLVLFCEID